VIIESEGRSGGSVKREKKGSMKKLPEGLENGLRKKNLHGENHF